MKTQNETTETDDCAADIARIREQVYSMLADTEQDAARDARALARVSEDDALSRYGMEVYGAGVVYYDEDTSTWYLNHRADLGYLRQLMDVDDDYIAESAFDDIAGNAYSHWCAGCTPIGEFAGQDAAIAFAAAMA